MGSAVRRSEEDWDGFLIPPGSGGAAKETAGMLGGRCTVFFFKRKYSKKRERKREREREIRD